MRIVFFKRPKPKQFTYRPRYWDEKKEQLEQIRKKYTDPDAMRSEQAMREQLDKKWRRGIDRSARKKTSGIMILVYLAIVALLAWFIFS